MKIRVRAGLVEARGLAKAMGERGPAWAADGVGVRKKPRPKGGGHGH